MRKNSWLVAFMVSISLTLAQAWAVGPTYIHDGIGASTTWSPDGNPYIVQNDITIAKGAVLTIEPGTDVHFVASGKAGQGPNLVVEGGLVAVGNNREPISFQPDTNGTTWGAIYFYGSDPANSILQACLIKGGRVVCNSASPTIKGCAIFGAQSGVEIALNSQPQIIHNRITADGVGFVLISDTSSPVIMNNEIYNNKYGFYLKDFGTPTISGNQIYNNQSYNIVNYSRKSLALANNDFRQTNPNAIARTIYDGLYNPQLGRVTFPESGTGMAPTQMAAGKTVQTKPNIQEDDLWSYGRPFDAMKISNLEAQQKKPSDMMKVLAVGATAVVTGILLFL
ncbi:MAG: right-handed parallel beta-helix repeat-containing protein [bacterium]